MELEDLVGVVGVGRAGVTDEIVLPPTDGTEPRRIRITRRLFPGGLSQHTWEVMRAEYWGGRLCVLCVVGKIGKFRRLIENPDAGESDGADMYVCRHCGVYTGRTPKGWFACASNTRRIQEGFCLRK